ncbi:MAG: mammalian cell entry protein [Cyclobacteriaceae bacterium]|nr:MAG: mammalian cell entry protein [Cyclobacteriaceae bacterium]
MLAVVSITVLYLGFNFLKGSNLFSPYNTYYAVYDNIDGLDVSNPILINGYSVGRVSKIEILQNDYNRLLVSLDINGDQQVGKNTRAIIKSDILGSKAIHLDSVGVGAPLKEGDTLNAMLHKGITEQLTNTAMPLVDQFEVTLQNLNIILANLANNEDNINQVIANFKNTSANIAKGTSRLDVMSTKLDKLLTELNNPETGVAALVSKMNQVADTVNSLELEALMTSTKKSIDQLGATLQQINEGDGNLNRLLKDDELYNNMTKTMGDLDKLFIDMRENPRRYVHFSVFGKKDKGSKEPPADTEETPEE